MNKIVAILSFVALFFIIQLPLAFAMEPVTIWKEKVVGKSFVWSGATTSKDETLLATYTTKEKINHYEIFKVNNVTSKVKRLSTLKGGEVFLFDFKGKGYVLHLQKKIATIYDENSKVVFTKSWKSNIKFHDFSITKSDVDDNLFVFGGNVYNFDSKKNDDFFVLMNLDKKGKLVEATSNKAPGEAYVLSFRFTSDKVLPIISQRTITNDHTNFEIKVDRSTIPNISDGYRISFSSNAITKYKDHFYFFLRENERGMGIERLLKVNNKGKVVDYLELVDNVSDTNEPQFIGNQIIFNSFHEEEEQDFYHIINLDSFTETAIASDSFDGFLDVLNPNVYVIKKNEEYQFYNAQNKLLYTLPANERIYGFGNKKNYGINLFTNTVYDLKTGAPIINTNQQPLIINDKALTFEAKPGYTEVKLLNLSSYN